MFGKTLLSYNRHCRLTQDKWNALNFKLLTDVKLAQVVYKISVVLHMAINAVRKEIHEPPDWSSQEQLGYACKQIKSPSNEVEVNFQQAVRKVFLKSVFGTYLRFFNSQQTHSKFVNDNKYGITKWDVKRLTDSEMKEFVKANDFITDDICGLLTDAVKNEECIDWEYLYGKLETLRIIDTNVSFH